MELELELKGPENDLAYSIPKLPEPYSFYLYNEHNNILPIGRIVLTIK